MNIEDLKNHSTTELQIYTIIESNDLRVRFPTLDQGHIVRLRRALQAGKTLPPIAIQARTNKLIFGWHRLAAHREERGGEGIITAYVLDIDDSAAIRLALAENSAHGLPMRRIDLQQAALVAQERGLSDLDCVQLLNIKPGMLNQLRHQVGRFHRGPEEGQRYTYRRGSQPSGLDMLNKVLTDQTVAPSVAASNGNGHTAADPYLTAEALTLPVEELPTSALEEDKGEDPMARVHGRFPTPAWLKAFMNSPLDMASGDVVLKPSLSHLRDHELTEAQVRANRFVAGTPQLTLVRQLVVLIYADALNMQSPTLMASLRDLRLALDVLDLDAPEASDFEPSAADKALAEEEEGLVEEPDVA